MQLVSDSLVGSVTICCGRFTSVSAKEWNAASAENVFEIEKSSGGTAAFGVEAITNKDPDATFCDDFDIDVDSVFVFVVFGPHHRFDPPSDPLTVSSLLRASFVRSADCGFSCC